MRPFWLSEEIDFDQQDDPVYLATVRMPSYPNPLLRIRDLRVAFAAKRILDSVSFELAPHGVTSIVGPVGGGKSTLLRTLAGHLDGVPGFTSQGDLLRSEDLERRPVALVSQSARLLMRTVFQNIAAGLRDRSSLTIAAQRATVRDLLAKYDIERVVPHLDQNVVDLGIGCQRIVSIVRCLAENPALLLVDEPTSGLTDEDRRVVVGLLRAAARERHVLCVTHNRKDSIELGGDVLLLADGKVVEHGPALGFFERPTTRAGELYTQTGSCLGLTLPPPPTGASIPAPRLPIPTGFHWIRKGSLAGVARPGLLASLEHDLSGLSAFGVETLLCLEETRPIPEERLREHGLGLWHFPIPDMGAPSVASGLALCETLHARLRAGERIAVHCKAGLGRTGTVLCALLIYEGKGALEALDAVRRVQWKFVQSEAQLAFLSALEFRVAEARTVPPSVHHPVG